MAIIYSYPIGTNLKGDDTIVGTSSTVVNGKRTNATKSFTLNSLATFITTTAFTDYVPYEGATKNINLGANSLYLNTINMYDDASGGYTRLQPGDNSLSIFNGSNLQILYVEGGTLTLFGGIDNSIATFNTTTLTENRSYLVPDQSGTIALTSDIPTFYGDTNQIPKLNGYALTASSIYDNGSSVGIGTIAPVTCAKLQIDSLTQGFLPPVMESADRVAIVVPTEGLIVFDRTISRLCIFVNGGWASLLTSDI